ncbi:MAG: DUF4115 domain-containing protein [Cyanobacteriota bacterium]|nr:DUF4115 domain-containing protein [Cyanobacteriota bacterium]
MNSDEDNFESNELLDENLSAALAELAELEQAAQQLPQIYEDKFRLGVVAIVEANRQLRAEQIMLRGAFAEALSLEHKPTLGRLPASRLLGRKLERHRINLAVVLLLAIVPLVGFSWVLIRPRPSGKAMATASSTISQAAPATYAKTSNLILRAQGTSWVEVQDLLSREVLLIGELAEGDKRTIQMRHGLRIRSGRPDLLTLQIGDAQPVPFGDTHGLDWRTVLPPVLKKEGA